MGWIVVHLQGESPSERQEIALFGVIFIKIKIEE